MAHPEIFTGYTEWSPSPIKWEALYIEPLAAFRRILGLLDRAPHQVAVRPEGGDVALIARRPDLLDEAGAPLPKPFAYIYNGLTPDTAEALRQQLKASGWSPSQA